MPSRPPSLSQHTASTQAANRRWSDERRGTAAARGYGHKWRKATSVFLAAHPLCRMCEEKSRVSPAELVDHIIPVQSADDPLFWDQDNWQPLCRPCHAIKTQADRASGLTRTDQRVSK